MKDLKSFFSDLERISWRGVKPGLERIRSALACLGHPERDFKIIHIAGTNGKGSSCSLIAELLAASGYSVGLSLSPHVHDYRERMQYYDARGIAPQMISETELLATHEKLLHAIPDDLGLTYFEWSIALAIQFFHDRGFDYVVLETGMGGRFDATNACPSLLSGITTIGLDHMEQLGGTLTAILDEKQEIIKPGSDFLFGSYDAQLIDQVRDHCELVGAVYHHVDQFNRFWNDRLEGHFLFQHKPAYYRDNFVFALGLGEILKKRGVAIDFESFLKLPEYHLPPARCEKIAESPEIFVDGAHNEPALKRLKEFADREWPDGYDLVFACLNDRDFMALAELILPKSGDCYWAKFDGGERTPPDSVFERVREQFGGRVSKLDDALRSHLVATCKPVLVCGSLYLCAQFAAFWRGCAHSGN